MIIDNITEKQVNKDGSILSYYTVNQEKTKPWICYFNGVFHGYKSWRKQLNWPFFKKNYNQLYIDYYGGGKSFYREDSKLTFKTIIKDIKEIFIKEEIRDCVLIGFSIGGMFAVNFTAEYPDLVKKLVLLNTAVVTNIHARKIIEAVIGQLREKYNLKKIFSFVYPWFFSGPYLEKLADLENDVLNEYADYNKNYNGVLDFLECLKNCPDLYEDLKKIKIPCMIAGSESDYIFPFDCQKYLAENLSDNKLHLIRNCGHVSYIEKSKEVNNIIKEFISKFDLKVVSKE